MMSSTTDTSVFGQQVGVLGTSRADLAQVVGEGGLEAVQCVRTLDPDGAEMADVEGDGVLAAGPVLAIVPSP